MALYRGLLEKTDVDLPYLGNEIAPTPEGCAASRIGVHLKGKVDFAIT